MTEARRTKKSAQSVQSATGWEPERGHPRHQFGQTSARAAGEVRPSLKTCQSQVASEHFHDFEKSRTCGTPCDGHPGRLCNVLQFQHFVLCRNRKPMFDLWRAPIFNFG